MGTSVTAERAARISSASSVSVGLVVALIASLVGGAVVYGRQSERLDSIDREVRELRGDVKEIRTLVVQQQHTGR